MLCTCISNKCIILAGQEQLFVEEYGFSFKAEVDTLERVSIVLDVLSCMCDGQNEDMQEILREQQNDHLLVR